MYILRLILITACTSLLLSNAHAAAYQSHSSIHKAARLHLKQHVSSLYKESAEIKPGILDSRLKLRKCTQTLETTLPEHSRGMGKISVRVKCSDFKPWSLHVPMTVSLFKKVLVASKPLPRNTLISDNDLKYVRLDLARLPHGYLDDIQQSIGKKLKRQLSIGTPLTPKMLEEPRLISKGQRVTILAQSNSMQVRTQGKALNHGVLGARIGVMNVKSRQKLEGVVLASGEVRVDI